MREKANKKCEVFIRTVEFFIYARYSARCLARAPAVDMDLKVDALLKMQVQLKLCMNLESAGGGASVDVDGSAGETKASPRN